MVLHSSKTLARGELGGGRKLPGERETRRGGQRAGVEVRETWKSQGNQKAQPGRRSRKRRPGWEDPDSAH